ncbi:nicotinate-nucleotide--dimethylbenzimidazole phosphoribosyltransferase [Ramlibacter albus]|uniref:Nicotinate-nucleotide--dimethylbenzimidazole phosphoribosyltransferase n=1 Tax=Ramlibacter albus TaxID=2079448 RepID=A0A923S4N7_9BURK|nr:nicotinate-nucleotide--dimethylbenzimidazole phosphoribosyltransferase [Ramlibacter albus]MBC5767705.1 nicotinate-nucleotide--dimethylbenzimidazole phosphoribosyltransferase [Ramlibacter albus]
MNLEQTLRERLDAKTKPIGSLGRLEDLAVQLGVALGTDEPSLDHPQMIVFAGDHGVAAAHGVSAYPRDVTWQMVKNILAGGAAVSVLARQHGIALTVVDCGVDHDFAPQPGLVLRKVTPGTADSTQGPAMTAAECAQAIQHGREVVRALPGNAVLLGELGIGNTSAASLLCAALAGCTLDDCVGPGTGLDAAGVLRKRGVLQRALELHKHASEPLQVLAAYGGFEIAAMVGAIQQAAQERRVVVVDGFISTSAVLVAHAVDPKVLPSCVFSHRSGERGHELMLRHLGAKPLLDLGLRLGEGSGAALAWPLLVSACLIMRDMATFESARVSGKTP